MKRIVNKLGLALLTMLLGLISMSSIAAYNDRGYVTAVTADNSGNCSFQLFYKESTGKKQGVSWRCGDTAGKNMLSLAEKAQKMNKKVKVYIENNGNTLYSIGIFEWPDQD